MSTRLATKRPLQLRLLVAHDRERMAHTLATILALAGCEVCAVYDGRATARILARTNPQLTLTDLSVPRSTAAAMVAAHIEPVPPFRVLLFTGGEDSLHIFTGATHQELPSELLNFPLRAGKLLGRLKALLSAPEPALLVPLETSPHVH